jgi:hypothetical protein
MWDEGTLLGPLEIANLSDWTQYSRSPTHLPADETRQVSETLCFRTPDDGQCPKSQ